MMIKYSNLDFYFRKSRVEATTLFANGYGAAVVKQLDENDEETGLNYINVLRHDENGLKNLHDFKLQNKSLINLTEDQVESILLDIINLPTISNFNYD